MSSVLPRLEIRLPQDLKDQVLALATARGVSASEIGVAALQDLLDKPARPEQALLDAVRRLEALLEGFIRVYFAVTPSVPGTEREAAARRGQERWAHLQALLQQGKEGGAWPA